MDVHKRNLILLGKTGTGKSSTGNTILQKKMFEARMSFNIVTEDCKIKTRPFHINGTTFQYTVVDTPGLFAQDQSCNLATVSELIQDAVVEVQEPIVFLLIFSARDRFTTTDKATMDLCEKIFGDTIWLNTIVIFTHGDEFGNEREFRKFHKRNDREILDQISSDRIFRIENEGDNAGAGRDEILQAVERMINRGRCLYELGDIDHQRRVFRNYIHVNHGYTLTEEQLKELRKLIEVAKPSKAAAIAKRTAVVVISVCIGAFLSSRLKLRL